MMRYSRATKHPGLKISIEPKKGLSADLGRMQRIAYDKILSASPDGHTCDEITDKLGVDRSVNGSHASEPRRDRLTRDSGVRRRNPSGWFAIKWIASPPNLEKSK